MQDHTKPALFGQSTLGKIRIEWLDAEPFLDLICTNNMKRAPGKVIYTGLLNSFGTFELDLLAMLLNNEG